MNNINNSTEKPEIIYPTNWSYKIIGLDTTAMENAACDILDGCEYKIAPSHKSSAGKYTSLNVSLEVESEDQRVETFKKFAAHTDIKMVI